MAFIPVPNGAQVAMQYTIDNVNQAVNVYNFARVGGGNYDATTLQSLLDAMLTWETISAKAARSSSVALTRMTARAMHAQNAPVVEEVLTTPVVGTVGNPVLPSQVTYAISLRTGFAGRSYRGRSYWIGLWESAVAGDFIDPAVATGLRGIIELLTGPSFTDESHEFSVLSRYINNAPRALGELTKVTDVVLVDYRVDTQRRRLINT